jgi:molybdenum cofactor biosynthesis enzyme MoaA
MTFSLQLQPNTKLSIDKIKKMLSDNKIKSIKSSNSELYCFANLSLNEIKLILVNNINSNEIVHLYEYAKKTMIKVQLSIINNEQMNKTNTKFNT